MKPSLHLKQQQKLKLSRQLQQNIRLLQLSSRELEQEVQIMLETNPLLELDNSDDLQEKTLETQLHNEKYNEKYDEQYDENCQKKDTLSDTNAITDTSSITNSITSSISETVETPFETAIDFSEFSAISDEGRLDFSASLDPSQEKDFFCPSALARGVEEKTLKQHLLWQMQTSLFSKSERLIANALIDAISEDGYLGCHLEEIQDTLHIQESCEFAMADIEAVLFKIQEFEPLGVAARHLSECLSLQLNHLPKETAWLLESKKLVNAYLDLLALKNYSALCSKLKISKSSLKDVILLITKLDPKPGRQMGVGKGSEYIIPDLILTKKNGSFVVKLNMDTIPKLRLNRDYTGLAGFTRRSLGEGGKSVDTARETQFFNEHRKEAEWFLKGLKNRYSTLLKVADCIVKKQTSFFSQGAEYMQGLSLQDLAEMTNLHESTISRVTNHKYLATPRGVFELKHFFSPEILSENGQAHATMAIRAMIKKIIEAELPSKPLSDEQIRILLKNQNISLSRRTISKYRQLMRIQSSTERYGHNPIH